MDLRLLQYFATAAELEHIGRAAERLHISQSPLSRQIRQLEKELQLDLFVRERQRIRLTESGKWLLSQAQKLLAHANKIRDEAEQRAQGNLGTLSVAFISAAMWSGILPRVLRRFHSEFPNANVELRNLRSVLQTEALKSGRIDVGFVSAAIGGNNVEVTCVAEEPFMLIVPASHRFSRKRTIVPADLNGADWILLSPSSAPNRQAQFLEMCAKTGFAPNKIQEVNDPNTLLGLVDSGLGVGLLQGSARNYAPRSLKFRSLPWISYKSRIYMIRPAQGRQPLADRFADFLPKLSVRDQL